MHRLASLNIFCISFLLTGLSAAFDTVDHDILIDRLHHAFGFYGDVLSWITSFVTGRTQRVRVGSQYSKCFAVQYGVPQGNVLGPILFWLYTADVLVIAARHGVSVHSYAEDTQLYLHTPAINCEATFARLVACIDDIGLRMSSNRLKLNAEKTQFTYFGTSISLPKLTAPSLLPTVQSSIFFLQ